MKARKREYDKIRYALKRELKIEKTGVEPRTYKPFKPTDYNQLECSNTDITGEGMIDIKPTVIAKNYPPEIQIQLDYAKLHYTPDAYQNLLKILN